MPMSGLARRTSRSRSDAAPVTGWDRLACRRQTGWSAGARLAHGRYMGETATITATSALRPYELRRGVPHAPAVSVVMAPAQSVITLLMQAASGQSWGAPAGLLAAVWHGLRPQARFAAQSFTARGWARIPDSCTPISPLADASVADHAARLRDLPTATLTGELLAGLGGIPCPPHWRPPAEQPRRWLNSTPAAGGAAGRPRRPPFPAARAARSRATPPLAQLHGRRVAGHLGGG